MTLNRKRGECVDNKTQELESLIEIIDDELQKELKTQINDFVKSKGGSLTSDEAFNLSIEACNGYTKRLLLNVLSNMFFR